VGKDVQFSVQYTVSNMTPPRENGTVFLPGINVLENVVSEGWVKLREPGKKEKSEEEESLLSKLKGLEDSAKSSGKGIWTSEGKGKVDVTHDITGKEKEFLEEWKGKDIDGNFHFWMTIDLAIIEATPSADRLRARLLLYDGSHQIIPIVLAGVRSPSASKKGTGEDVPESSGQAEEFGDEARWYVESRLLQRNVKVEIMYPS
jgi:staphylococcal nuclease domain-containing protein 1